MSATAPLALPLPQLLLTLAAQRATEATLLKEINTQQAALEAARKASYDSNSVWSQQEKLRSLYEKAHTLASEEWRLTQDILHNVRSTLRQRRRDNGGADMADAPAAADEDDDDDEPLLSAPAAAAASKAAAASSGGRVPVLNKNDRLNIWHHDAHSVLPNGSAIAALIDEHSIPPLWIQSSVKGYRGGARPKYEVVDEDPGDPAEDGTSGPARQKRYLLDPRKILPLPSLEQVPLSSRKEFSKGTRVLAVFPTGGITVLYPAQVVQPPKKRKSNEYLLMFDDDEEVHRVVNAQFVAPMVEFHDNA